MGCFTSDTKPKESGTYGLQMPMDTQEALNFALNRGAEEGLVSQVALHISCSDLINVDKTSLTDSACVVYLKNKKYFLGRTKFNNRSGIYTKVGQTEVITDNLNPVFVKSILMNYYFEERQDVRISVYDVDDFSPNANVEQKLIGSVEFRLDQVLHSLDAQLTLPIIGYFLIKLLIFFILDQ